MRIMSWSRSWRDARLAIAARLRVSYSSSTSSGSEGGVSTVEVVIPDSGVMVPVPPWVFVITPSLLSLVVADAEESDELLSSAGGCLRPLTAFFETAMPRRLVLRCRSTRSSLTGRFLKVRTETERLSK